MFWKSNNCWNIKQAVGFRCI